MPRLAHLRSERGATLVEVLVALGMGALILTVLFLAHFSLTREITRQSRQDILNDRIDNTMMVLREDLQQLMVPPDDPDGAIILENSATQLVRFSFCRWTRTEPNADILTNQLERVTYQFSSGSDPVLEYIQEPFGSLALSTPATTNRLPDTWPRLVVHLHDGESWKTNWVPPESVGEKTKAPRPQAARIRLLKPDAADESFIYETVVVIPYGLTVTSRMLRASSAR